MAAVVATIIVYAARRSGSAWPALSSPLRHPLIVPFLAAPWILGAFTMAWEAGLMPYLPDAVNDVLIPLMLKIVLTVSAFFYVPVVALGIASLLMGTLSRAEGLLGKAWPPGRTDEVMG